MVKRKALENKYKPILIPFYKKKIKIVDMCKYGKSNPTACKKCDIENCRSSGMFKWRQYILGLDGESDE